MIMNSMFNNANRKGLKYNGYLFTCTFCKLTLMKVKHYICNFKCKHKTNILKIQYF